MKLTEINTNNITDDIIKKVLFNIPKSNYNKADILIIFGCHIKELLDERLEQAIKILTTKDINKIVLTGGIGVNGDFNESSYMEDYLLKKGIPKDRLLIENKSTTTEENIINTINLLKHNNLLENKKILLLSNQAHLRRIDMELKKQLKHININLLYDYPEISILSYNNIINKDELRNIAIKQVKKIITFIHEGIIDDEEI